MTSEPIVGAITWTRLCLILCVSWKRFDRALEQALQHSFAIMDAHHYQFGKISTQIGRVIGWRIATQGGIDIEAYICFTTQADCCGSLRGIYTAVVHLRDRQFYLAYLGALLNLLLPPSEFFRVYLSVCLFCWFLPKHFTSCFIV